MANAGFNAATDLFGLGSSFKVKSCNLNKGSSAAECFNKNGDATHRDVYAERIAPSAEYELAADITAFPVDLGEVVEIDGKSVAISSITINTAYGQAVGISVQGVQVEDDAATKRSYELPTLALNCRHRAQDFLLLLGDTTPSHLNSCSVTFTVNVTLGEAKGVIVASDCSDGKYEASFEHAVGDTTAVTAPTVSGTSRIVSAPVSKSYPENGYTTVSYAITDSLTGTDAS